MYYADLPGAGARRCVVTDRFISKCNSVGTTWFFSPSFSGVEFHDGFFDVYKSFPYVVYGDGTGGGTISNAWNLQTGATGKLARSLPPMTYFPDVMVEDTDDHVDWGPEMIRIESMLIKVEKTKAWSGEGRFTIYHQARAYNRKPLVWTDLVHSTAQTDAALESSFVVESGSSEVTMLLTNPDPGWQPYTPPWYKVRPYPFVGGNLYLNNVDDFLAIPWAGAIRWRINPSGSGSITSNDFIVSVVVTVTVVATGGIPQHVSRAGNVEPINSQTLINRADLDAVELYKLNPFRLDVTNDATGVMSLVYEWFQKIRNSKLQTQIALLGMPFSEWIFRYGRYFNTETRIDDIDKGRFYPEMS